MKPETRYARLGGSCIAYQVVGDGPMDLVYLGGMVGNVDASWEYPLVATFFERLASFSRLILFDRRGCGASDPVPLEALPAWEEWAEDLRVVLDAAGSERVAIVAERDAGWWGMLFAATYPQRTSALVLANAAPKYIAEDGFPGLPRESAEEFARWVEEAWGTELLARAIHPTLAHDERAMSWLSKYMRLSMSPRAAAAQFRYIFDIDARRVLPMIHAPTLVIHGSAYIFHPSSASRYLADHIPGARYVELPGRDSTFMTQADVFIDLVEEFLTGAPHRAEPDRSLATVLFTDMAGSTDRAAALGDRRWKELLDAHDQIALERIESFGGRLIKTTGDGVLATFDGPGRAIRCAFTLQDALREIGIDIRTGLHAGEVELRGNDIGGIAVHIAARVTDVAAPGEIICSRTVRDLVAGSGFAFDDRGVRALKGVPEEWQLFAVRGPHADLTFARAGGVTKETG